MRLDRSRDALRYGVFYALAKADIESPMPIDATRTWRFWTKYRNQLAKFLAENYPPQFIASEAVRLVGLREYSRYLTLCVLAWKFIDEKYATIHRFAFEKLGD